MTLLSRAAVLILWGVLPARAGPVSDCAAEYESRRAHQREFCGYGIAQGEWSQGCVNGRSADQIRRGYCERAYLESYQEQFSMPRAAWKAGCLGRREPGEMLIEACAKMYKPAYQDAFEVPRAEWDKRCGACVAPGDLLAVLIENCRHRYDEALKSYGVSQDVYDRDCAGALGGLSWLDYVKEKRKLYALKTPTDQLSVGDALKFVQSVKDSDSQELRDKRDEVQKRLGQAQETRKKFGQGLERSQWNALPLAVAGADSEDGVQRLAKTFDLAGLKAGSGFSSSGAVFAGAGGGSAPDLRPLAPVQKGKGLDAGIDAPAKVKARLEDKVTSLGLQRDPKTGKKVYEPGVISMMRTLVSRARTDDPVVLKEVAQTIDYIDESRPRIVIDDAMDSYGSHSVADDGVSFIKIRTKDHDTGDRFSDRLLAMTLHHEVTHAWERGIGGSVGTTMGEGLSFNSELRWAAGEQETFDELLLAKREALKRDQGKLPGDEFVRRMEEIARLEKAKVSFLDDANASDLDTYRRDGRAFTLDMIGRYYGPDHEFEPGKVSLADRRKAALKDLDDAKAELTRTLAGKNWALKKIGYKTEAEEIAEGNLSEAEDALKRIAVDERIEKERRERDKAWRKSKKEKCETLLAQDSDYQGLLKDIAAQDAIVASPAPKDKKKRAKWRARVAKAQDLLDSYGQMADTARDLYGVCTVH